MSKPIRKKECANLSFDPEVLAAIDSQRRHIPRSTFINDIMWQLFVATDDQLESIEKYSI